MDYAGSGGVLMANLGLGLPVRSSGTNDMRETDAHQGGSSKLTDYFGDYSGKPLGASFDLVLGRGEKRPRIEGDLNGPAPYGARDAKRQKLDIQRGGLGGFMTEGITTALSDSVGSKGRTINMRGIEFAFPQNDVTYKSTIGFLSNPTIPANETVLKKMPGYELPGGYDIVIMRNHLNMESQELKRHPHTTGLMDDTPRTAFTIPGFNRWLLTKQATYSTVAEYIASLQKAQESVLNVIDDELFLDETQPWHIHSADDILRVFSMSGVIDTENFANNVSSVNYLDEGMDQTQVNSNNKKVNRVIYGRVDIFNIFGAGLEVGTPLYLVVKRAKRPAAYRTDSTRDMTVADINFMTAAAPKQPDPDAMDVDEDAPRLVTKTVTDPWMIIPWADNNKKHPTREDLEFITPLGTKAYGKAICIGYVMKEDYSAADNLQATMATDLQAIHTRQILDIYLFS